MKMLLVVALALTSVSAFADGEKLLCTGSGKFANIGSKVVSIAELTQESLDVPGVKGKILSITPFVKAELGGGNRLLLAVQEKGSIHTVEGNVKDAVIYNESLNGNDSILQCLPMVR